MFPARNHGKKRIERHHAIDDARRDAHFFRNIDLRFFGKIADTPLRFIQNNHQAAAFFFGGVDNVINRAFNLRFGKNSFHNSPFNSCYAAFPRFPSWEGQGVGSSETIPSPRQPTPSPSQEGSLWSFVSNRLRNMSF